MRPRSANEWRDFWRDGGERELYALLDGVAGTGSSPFPGGPFGDTAGTSPRRDDSFAPYSVRIATLLGSNAPIRALVAELGRIREHELRVAQDPERDAELAERIYGWFVSATASSR